MQVNDNNDLSLWRRCRTMEVLGVDYSYRRRIPGDQLSGGVDPYIVIYRWSVTAAAAAAHSTIAEVCNTFGVYNDRPAAILTTQCECEFIRMAFAPWALNDTRSLDGCDDTDDTTR